MKKLYFLLLIAVSFLFVQCGGSSTSLSKADQGDIPDWYLNQPQDPNYLFAVNTSTSQDLQLAVDKSITAARAEIARQLEVKLSALQKKFTEEVGSGDNSTLLSQFTQAAKIVTSTTLNGSSIKEKKIFKDGNIWRAYVLMQYPMGTANQALMKQIKKNNEMYTRFRSTKAFQELDKEVKKYDESKNK